MAYRVRLDLQELVILEAQFVVTKVCLPYMVTRMGCQVQEVHQESSLVGLMALFLGELQEVQ